MFSLIHINACQFTSIMQKVLDKSKGHRSLQNCGSSVWDLLKVPFWYRECRGASQIFKNMWTRACVACGQDTIPKAHMFEWHTRFSEESMDVVGNKWAGHLVTKKTDENVEKVRKLVTRDCHLSIRMTAEQLNMDKENTHILTKNHKKLCAKMVPKIWVQIFSQQNT
jgi:hypothetical protein